MRPLWTGTISFGLVNIPVSLYSASKARAIDFDMLHKKDLGGIEFKRFCKVDGQEVPYEEIVKGYEISENKYVVLDKEDFAHASPKKSERIDIEAFVDEKEIDPKYFSRPYYVEPQKGGDKAYVLLREALAQIRKVAVAKIIFRDREDLVILQPEGDMLLLVQMRYPDEIREPQGLNIPSGIDVKKEEISMALELIEKLEGKFDPEKYKNTYVEKLADVIKQKNKGKKFAPLPKHPSGTLPEDLVAQLRASLSDKG